MSTLLNRLKNALYYRWQLLISGNKSKTISFLSHPLKVNTVSSFIQLKIEIFGDEIYQFHSAQEKPLIIDCGANIGLSVLYFKRMYPHAIVHAFEPDAKNFDILSFNIESFKLANVHLHKKAVWIENTVLTFEAIGDVSGKLTPEQTSGVKVNAIRLKEFLQGFDKIDMLKMDIEGAELTVLKDIQSEFAKINFLFVEYHSDKDQPQQLDELLQLLKQGGFRYYIDNVFSDQYKLNKKPFVDRNTNAGFDVQLNIYAYKK